jgi:hypothetical protein
MTVCRGQSLVIALYRHELMVSARQKKSAVERRYLFNDFALVCFLIEQIGWGRYYQSSYQLSVINSIK